MIEWSKFDKLMLEAEWLYSKNRLSFDVVKTLKRNSCWRDGKPFCGYDYFTYSMTEKQIKDICDSINNLKTAKV